MFTLQALFGPGNANWLPGLSACSAHRMSAPDTHGGGRKRQRIYPGWRDWATLSNLHERASAMVFSVPVMWKTCNDIMDGWANPQHALIACCNLVVPWVSWTFQWCSWNLCRSWVYVVNEWVVHHISADRMERASYPKIMWVGVKYVISA